jgi:predicted P-loop ATPase
MPEGGSIDDLPEPLDRSETIATIEKAANEQWQKQNREAGKKERAVRKITTKSAKEGESSSQSKRQRLAPDEVVELLPDKVGHLRLNSRNGEITAGDKILPPNTITRLYLELSDNEQQWPKETTIDAVAHLAAQDAFDPVAEYLVSIATPALPREQWERLDRHLLGIDDPIAAAFLPRYFIAAVARTFEPGCDCRQLPVLIGPQWRGKSALGRILFGAEQWVEGIGDLGKDALLKAHTAWGVELAELDGVTRRSDQESLKAFISETADTIRKPYDRSPERFPRRFVFWGTSNGAPLRDLTGNSRYVCIPIPDKMLPLGWATENRDALWAKALEQYQAGVQWRDCSEQERQAITERNEEHGQVDPWADMVSFFINNNKAGCQYVELKEVLEMLEIPIERQNNQTAKRVIDILGKMGWKKERRRFNNGVQIRAFWRPEPTDEECLF